MCCDLSTKIIKLELSDFGIVEDLIRILNAYENGKDLISNQGQALDGFSALAEFVGLATKARKKESHNAVQG